MERTDLREEFFRRASEDPYLHQVQKMWADAWVYGYLQAFADCKEHVFFYRREHDEIDDFVCSRSHPDLIEQALEFLTAQERQAQDLVALATLETKMERLASDHIARPMASPNRR